MALSPTRRHIGNWVANRAARGNGVTTILLHARVFWTRKARAPLLGTESLRLMHWTLKGATFATAVAGVLELQAAILLAQPAAVGASMNWRSPMKLPFLLLLVSFAGTAFAQSSSRFTLTRSVIAGGGVQTTSRAISSSERLLPSVPLKHQTKAAAGPGRLRTANASSAKPGRWLCS